MRGFSDFEKTTGVVFRARRSVELVEAKNFICLGIITSRFGRTPADMCGDIFYGSTQIGKSN